MELRITAAMIRVLGLLTVTVLLPWPLVPVVRADAFCPRPNYTGHAGSPLVFEVPLDCAIEVPTPTGNPPAAPDSTSLIPDPGGAVEGGPCSGMFDRGITFSVQRNPTLGTPWNATWGPPEVGFQQGLGPTGGGPGWGTPLKLYDLSPQTIWQYTYEVRYLLTNARWHLIGGEWHCGEDASGQAEGLWAIACTAGGMAWDPLKGGALNNPCILPVAPIPAPAPPRCNGPPTSPGCPPLELVRTELNPAPGRIGFSPVDPEMHVVQLKSCFWIEGSSVAEQELGIMVPRGPEVDYFYVRLGLVGVDWNFGDGSGVRLTGTDGLGRPAPGADCLHSTSGSDHTYRRISQGSTPDDHFLVSAQERYGLTVQGQRCQLTSGGLRCSAGSLVDITGLCPAGYEPNPLSGGCDRSYPLNQPIFVGQIEAIPITTRLPHG